ncbi:hypothetical protein [Alicyclobacillus dauci]|uniref:PEP-CTERM protein-sorting domain-containing protein n=1 Tax=Alicyclobacillus dauci TaxID=1475485 RepID=A0ABY6YX80_9BACL|nr:hypothetical protein [Alicyclobacillus dauci]WAH35198.1 hypothetical protein NZD86_12830 [Alicyclobacillus dauci]
MKRRMLSFVIYFLVLFIGGLIINAIFKHHLDVLTAFSVALGVALGLYSFPKLMKK